MPCVGKKVKVLELVPMDLLDNVGEIAMTNLLILYNSYLMPFTICAPPLLGKLEQQGLNAKEKLHERIYLCFSKKEETKIKAIQEVDNREVNMKRCSRNLSIPRSFQFCVIGKKRMVDKKQRSNDVTTRPDIYSTKLSENPPYRNPSLGLATKARAYKGASQEKARKSHFMLPGM